MLEITLLFLFFSWVTLPTMCFENEKVCLSKIPALINDIVGLHTDWKFGIEAFAKIKDEKEFYEIYERNSKQLFLPASTTKLFSSSSALLSLSEEYRFKTSLFEKTSKDGITNCIRFMGDPSFSYENLQNVTSFISKDCSRIFIDATSYFGEDNEDFPPTWEWDDLPLDYAARPIESQLNINKDVLHIQAGEKIGDEVIVKWSYSPIPLLLDTSKSKTVSGKSVDIDYKYFLGDTKLYIVGSIGINASPVVREIAIMNPRNQLKNVVKQYRKDVDVQEVVSCEKEGFGVRDLKVNFYSDVLYKLMNYTLLVSDNTYAELFMRQIGAKSMNTSECVSKTAHRCGLERINTIVSKELKVDENLFSLSDGSGVSRQTFISPLAEVTLLHEMLSKKPILQNLLPNAGLSGTLKDRFLDHKGILRAKTGTLTGVNALAGYIVRPQFFEKVIFSIIVNNSQLSSTTVREYIDKIAIYFAFADPSC